MGQKEGCRETICDTHCLHEGTYLERILCFDVSYITPDTWQGKGESKDESDREASHGWHLSWFVCSLVCLCHCVFVCVCVHRNLKWMNLVVVVLLMLLLLQYKLKLKLSQLSVARVEVAWKENKKRLQLARMNQW